MRTAEEKLQDYLAAVDGVSPPWDEYEIIAAKPILSVWEPSEIDFYVWYYDKTEAKYIFMYGMEEPDREYADWEEESFYAAHEWFINYEGGCEHDW